MTITAKSRFVRTAPQKIRILTSMLKSKTLEDAIAILNFSNKYAANPLILVLKEAKDQIKDKNIPENTFLIKEIRVDEGPKLKRRRIRHQGRATAILKRMSHITVILANEPNKEKPKKGKSDGSKS